MLEEIVALETGAAKVQISTIFDHLNGLGLATIVEELGYVDRHYVEDFRAYITSFTPIKPHCRRLHFFDKPIERHEFDKIVNGEAGEAGVKKLQDSYLGFMVLRPIPSIAVGRTCLATYPRSMDADLGVPAGRFQLGSKGEGATLIRAPFVRRYEADLAGIMLAVYGLAFQEQDAVAAACATSALWSSLHRRLFDNPVPSPIQITQHATQFSGKRSIPSEGLNAEEVLLAVKHVGLEADYLEADDFPTGSTDGKARNHLARFLYGYGRLGVPIVVSLQLCPIGYRQRMPFHAVTLSGMELAGPSPRPQGEGLRYKADRLSHVFVHDDQTGPYFRSAIGLRSHDFTPTEGYSWNPKGKKESWTIDLGEKLRLEAKEVALEGVISALFVPLDSWIRVTFKHAQETLEDFTVLLALIWPGQGALAKVDPGSLEWDLRLSTVHQYRESIRTQMASAAPARRAVLLRQLTANLPLYVWRATAEHRGKAVVELVMDATAIPDQNLAKAIVACSDELDNHMRDVCRDSQYVERLSRTMPSWIDSPEVPDGSRSLIIGAEAWSEVPSQPAEAAPASKQRR